MRVCVNVRMRTCVWGVHAVFVLHACQRRASRVLQTRFLGPLCDPPMDPLWTPPMDSDLLWSGDR